MSNYSRPQRPPSYQVRQSFYVKNSGGKDISVLLLVTSFRTLQSQYACFANYVQTHRSGSSGIRTLVLLELFSELSMELLLTERQILFNPSLIRLVSYNFSPN